MSTSDLFVCTTCFSLTSLGRGMQSCRCEENKEYPGVDCPSGYHLCYMCATSVAGGTSRWSWNACESCLKFNRSLASKYGIRIPLGRHSIMNSIGIALKGSKEEQAQATTALLEFLDISGQISDWGLLQAQTLFASNHAWCNEAHIPLMKWEAKFHLSKVKTAARTVQAFKDYLRVDGFEEIGS